MFISLINWCYAVVAQSFLPPKKRKISSIVKRNGVNKSSNDKISISKSNRVRTIDAFSDLLVLVLVLGQVPVLLTVAYLVILSCFIPSCTFTILKMAQFRDFNSCVTDGPTDGRTYPLIEMRERI